MNKHYHFIGIGGVGMGTIASLLIAKGYRVSGSDLKESDFTAKLREQKAKISIGHDAKNIESPDFVVYSSAVSRDNPERVAAEQKKIPVLQRAQLLAQLMESEKGITVAGAHGKTTTTSMISYCLIRAGLNPTTAVGGMINNDKTYNSNLGSGQYFVAEVDESDGSFLYFSPFYSVITNIDFEHVDYYHSWDNILSAYRTFIARTKADGCIFAYGQDMRLRSLLSESGRRFTTYGFSKENDVVASHEKLNGRSLGFDCAYKGRNIGRFDLSIPGKHNILNALACICVSMQMGIDLEVIRESLREFKGVRRRFQLKTDVNDIMVIDDYGHHPTEIKATIETAKSLGRKRVVTVFQPHRYTRTKFLMEEFVKSLSASDCLVITDIYAASEEVIPGVTSEKLCELIRASGKPEVIYLKKERIIDYLLDNVRKGDLVLTLGAGDITRISDAFAQKLNDRNVEPIAMVKDGL
ncbi:MAG TPA: UDP-N-acetylmuramate--L-alanine ligase [Candidatus Omnitrophota bacterium]|nr:UDP-N-acetylmuramate--L-alanine ligase [Candidatus Omnitrophota bacterium]HPD85106.1 UDP-N-acetylmuramate--L-alanine ligase [Candidatus Omnitrophota bacterium]HRZ03964.1 UDP-N-acetylmuramate--L-alanine ligase [Candidatus Omnitrophota bacterium]